MNIYLTGMIGSGKTTVGKALARRLGWAFDDLDLAMERLTGKTFREVVRDEGWLGFREHEYEICKQFARLQRTVVALGGGTVRYQWNRDALADSGVVILLVADLDVLADRVRDNDRPRVNVEATLEEDLARIWSQSEERYTGFANIIYRTDQGKSVAREVDDLLALLSRYLGPDRAAIEKQETSTTARPERVRVRGTRATMRACRIYGTRDLRFETALRPEPESGEVLLQVASVGVCGSDVHYYLEGRIGSQVIDSPLIMGHEFSARVIELGAGVTGLTPGQLVAVEPGVSCGHCEMCQQGHPNLCCNILFCGCPSPPFQGALADYVVMPAHNCFPLPDSMNATVGALLEPLGIAIHAVDLAHLRPGSTVAVLGAGPIGLLTASVARVAGATEVYMSEPLADRRSAALGFANYVVDPGGGNAAAEILRLTGGRGVDVAFEAAGAPEAPQQAATVTRPGGTVIIIGIPPDDTMTVSASTVRGKGLTIKVVRRMKHTYPRAIRLVERGIIDLAPIATHHFPLERTPEAFELVAGKSDGVLKAVIDVAP